MATPQSQPFAKGTALFLILTATAAGAARAGEDSLRARIDAALLRLGPHATAAVRVLSLDRGTVLYERNPDLSLNPASNMKLLTSAAALARLGPDYRFTTRVLVEGKRSGEKVSGDLVLQGGGDPVLETPGLEQLAEAVRDAGIRRVSGGLRVDDYRFDAERLGNGWNSDDEPFYYSAQISALSVNRNVLQVDVSPGMSEGDAAEVKVKPLEEHLRILERPKTGPAGSEGRISITRERARNEIRIRGTIARDGRPVLDRDVTVEEPALFAGALFRQLLEKRGVRIKGETRREAASAGAAQGAPVAAVQSPPLSRIVALLNKPSDNLVAEMLLKELGYAVRKKGDAVSGSEVVEGWLRELGIETGGVRVNDGSGLSRMDLVTSRAVSELLVRADAQPWRETFRASLPVAGVDGTLRNRMKGTAAEKNVLAKTGSLAHVSALGGYVTAADGERLVFSILINNFPGPGAGPTGMKRIEDMIAVALAESRQHPEGTRPP